MKKQKIERVPGLRNLPACAQELWARVSSTDTWGCKYVYEHGARKIWDAAIRHERKLAHRDTERLDFLLNWLAHNENVSKLPVRDWDDNQDARKAIDAALVARDTGEG
jgi:hypothetical protein